MNEFDFTFSYGKPIVLLKRFGNFAHSSIQVGRFSVICKLFKLFCLKKRTVFNQSFLRRLIREVSVYVTNVSLAAHGWFVRRLYLLCEKLVPSYCLKEGVFFDFVDSQAILRVTL